MHRTGASQNSTTPRPSLFRRFIKGCCLLALLMFCGSHLLFFVLQVHPGTASPRVQSPILALHLWEECDGDAERLGGMLLGTGPGRSNRISTQGTALLQTLRQRLAGAWTREAPRHAAPWINSPTRTYPSSSGANPDADGSVRRSAQAFRPSSGSGFEAAERLMNAQPGSPEAHRAMGDLTREVSGLPIRDRSFEAAERLLNAQPGSPEANWAMGEVTREATGCAARMLGEGAREAVNTLRTREFWQGLGGKPR